MQIGWPVEALPNLAGFRFRGVLQNGDLLSCVVMQGDDGLHYAESVEDGRRVYGELRGWMQWLPPNTQFSGGADTPAERDNG